MFVMDYTRTTKWTFWWENYVSCDHGILGCPIFRQIQMQQNWDVYESDLPGEELNEPKVI